MSMSDSSDLDNDSSSDEEVDSSEKDSDTEEYDPVPKLIKETNEFTDISFHPSSATHLAAANIVGYVSVYQCNSGEACIEKKKVRVSKSPCRCMAFSEDGDEIFVLTKDKIFKTLCSMTGKVKAKINDIHESSPYSLCVVNKNIIATGDEDGILKIWDLRKGKKAILEEEAFEDYISSIAVDDKQRLIFAVSGDGTMSTYNTRRRKLVVKSQKEKQDLMCAQVMKCNTRLAVGCATGFTLLYHWDQFAAAADRFPCQGSVDCMAKISEDVICTGSSDGRIRAVHLVPNRILGVIGKHHGFPIEKVRTNVGSDWLASISHDNTIRFWAVDYLHRIEVDDNKKADKSRKFRLIDRHGVVNKRAQFVSDIEKDMEVPIYNVDSDELTTSEEDGETKSDAL